MRARFALCGLGLCLLGAGCSLGENATRLAAHNLTQSLDDFKEKRRDRQWAEDAWEQFRKTLPNRRCSEDLAEGFKQGFADFLYRGGDGEPPPLPPIKYRALRYQSPQGYQAVEDWFAGFREGAAQAKQSDYRQWITGPSSLRMAESLPPVVEEIPTFLPPPAELKQTQAVPPKQSLALELKQPPAAEPIQPVAAPLNDKKPTTVAAVLTALKTPPAAAEVQARYRAERNAWQVQSKKPDRGEIHVAWMSPQAFTELMQKVRSDKQENQGLAGRHSISVDGGSSAEVIEVDDATYDNLVATLLWYYENLEN